MSLRVFEDMDRYADVILHESDARFSDSEDAAVDLLNRESLSKSCKEEYIRRSDTILEDIHAVTSRTLWSALMESHGPYQ